MIMETGERMVCVKEVLCSQDVGICTGAGRVPVVVPPQKA